MREWRFDVLMAAVPMFVALVVAFCFGRKAKKSGGGLNGRLSKKATTRLGCLL